tara:strand:- start:68 stop:256 length:189 start_codon:yes stop_codon:yes gene_type:complete
MIKRDAILGPRDFARWAGSPSDFKLNETELAFEGLKKKRLLIRAGWASLRDYVDYRLSELKS